MTKDEAQLFEATLLQLGYRKWTQAKYGEEDYDVSRMFRDDDEEQMYQIIYRFWDWTKYGYKDYTDFSVDIVIMPCLHTYGRADLILSSCEFKDFLNVDWTERFAKDYYDFVIKHIEK